MTESFASKKKRGRLPYSEEKAIEIAGDILSAIRLKKLVKGDYIPTSVELMKFYKVSSHTTIRARQILYDKGVIEKPVRGRNVRVM